MKPDGLMVPSQTRIMLAGITGEGMYNEAFGFWDRVYGACAVRPKGVTVDEELLSRGVCD
jgi:protein arginine N-methyltransferase 3